MEMLDATTAKALEEFVRNGGWLWADGRCAFLDVGIFLRNEIPGHGLARVFGCNEADFIAVRESESFLLKNRTGSGLESGSGSGLELELKPFRFKQKLAATTGETTVTCNGEPVGMRNHYGKGCAELLGTYLCLGIHAAMDNPVMKAQLEAMQNVIVDFVRASGVPVRNDITTGFEISHLANDKLDVYIVTNRNAGGTELRMPLLQPCTTVECPQGGASFVGGVVRRDFAPMESALFVCRKLSRQ
jgi:hypothetical protein